MLLRWSYDRVPQVPFKKFICTHYMAACFSHIPPDDNDTTRNVYLLHTSSFPYKTSLRGFFFLQGKKTAVVALKGKRKPKFWSLYKTVSICYCPWRFFLSLLWLSTCPHSPFIMQRMWVGRVSRPVSLHWNSSSRASCCFFLSQQFTWGERTLAGYNPLVSPALPLNWIYIVNTNVNVPQYI